jgi:hypothetical protein
MKRLIKRRVMIATSLVLGMSFLGGTHASQAQKAPLKPKPQPVAPAGTQPELKSPLAPEGPRPVPNGAAILGTQSISVNDLATGRTSSPLSTTLSATGEKGSNIEITKAGAAPIDPIQFFRVPSPDQGVRVRMGQSN